MAHRSFVRSCARSRGLVGSHVQALEARQLLSLTLPAYGTFAFGTDGTGGLNSASYTYGEEAGVVQVPVYRVGGSEGAVTVDYATSGGAATPSNFVRAQGTLHFAAGQDVAYLPLTLVDDALSQPTQRLTLSLLNPHGGALVPTAPTTATVFVLDNEPNNPMLVAAPDAGQAKPVQVFDGQGNLKYSLHPYGANFKGGIRVALGDLNDDSTPDIIVTSAAGKRQDGALGIKVYDGATGAPLLTEPLNLLMPYGPGYRGGVFIAAGDITGDGVVDLMTGTDVGVAPHVKVFDGASGNEIQSFYAFEPTAKTGVRVAFGRGSFDGLGVKPALIAGSGPGAGQLSVYVPVQAADQAPLSRVGNFYPFGTRATVGMAVSASSGTGPMTISVASAAKSGRGATQSVQSHGVDGSLLRSVAPYGAKFNGLSRVQMADYDSDGVDDVIICSAGGSGRVRALCGRDRHTLFDFAPYGKKSAGMYVAIEADDALTVARAQQAG